MFEIHFPDREPLQIENILCDINGTLSVDGNLIPGVAAAVEKLKTQAHFFLLSADTAGTAKEIARELGVELNVIHAGDEALQKEQFIQKIGANQTIAIGQGANDELMLKAAALGICVLSAEGTAVKTLFAADIVVANILIAFELFQNPKRITATLRK